MSCSSCGYAPVQGMKFCPQCGARVAAMNAPLSGPMQPPPVPNYYGQQQYAPPPATYPPPSQTQWNGSGGLPPTAPSQYTSPAPTAPPPKPKIDVPPAATGEEAAAIYKRMLAAVRGANSNNDEVVSAFKRDCKEYGQGAIKAKAFYERLGFYFGSPMMLEHILPQLVRLIPDEQLRKKLLKCHARKVNTASTNNTSGHNLHRNSSMSSMASSGSSRGSSDNGRPRPSSTSDVPRSSESASAGGRLSAATSKLRISNYADSPLCSICGAEFDHLKKRRHTCRKCSASVCSLCSPARMLIPPEQVALDAKDYDPSHPQRVCTICAPMLQAFQDGLNAQFANCHKENPHQSKTRLHLPYSKSLEQECRNAADIIGNFFRPDFGASSDRSIPVAFLKRAHGLAFLTVVKVGILISAKAGTGIVVSKLPDGSWSAPSAIGTAGISGGFEAGGEIVEFMIILGSEGAVKVFHRTQVSIGGGLSVAVGPYGRDASAQAAASRGGVNANYSYSHSRGLYVGVSLEGAVVHCRSDVNSNFYGKQLTPEEILSGQVPRPRAAQCLYDAIGQAMEGVAVHDASAAQSRENKDVCMYCQCRQFVSKPFSKKCKSCSHEHNK